MMDGNKCQDNKELLIILGAVHTDLYDIPDFIPAEKIAYFSNEYLNIEIMEQ